MIVEFLYIEANYIHFVIIFCFVRTVEFFTLFWCLIMNNCLVERTCRMRKSCACGSSVIELMTKRSCLIFFWICNTFETYAYAILCIYIYMHMCTCKSVVALVQGQPAERPVACNFYVYSLYSFVHSRASPRNTLFSGAALKFYQLTHSSIPSIFPMQPIALFYLSLSQNIPSVSHIHFANLKNEEFT